MALTPIPGRSLQPSPAGRRFAPSPCIRHASRIAGFRSAALASLIAAMGCAEPPANGSLEPSASTGAAGRGSDPHPFALIELSPAALDFGELAAGASSERTVRISNLADAAIVVRPPRTSCACTTAAGPMSPIPPGAAAELVVQLKVPARTRRPLAASVLVTCVAGETTSDFTLPVRARIVAASAVDEIASTPSTDPDPPL